MSTTAATFCATLVDEWVRAGTTDAFVAPGSRSTPMSLALLNDRRIRLHLFHDERSAGFAAIGHAMATGHPAVLVCTSGTAAAHFHAAVIEADLSAVPLIVCTTDRPPELWGVGAPQTVDQNRLFGDVVRFYAEPGVPTAEMRSAWRSLASRAAAEARGWSGTPGPVHLNLSFRDPLVAEPDALPPARGGREPWHAQAAAGPSERAVAAEAVIDELWGRIRGLSGVIVAGHETADPQSVLALGRKLGWPVLADHRSGCRSEGQAIAHFDALLRCAPFAGSVRPDVVLRFGQPLASKALGQWLASSDADVVSIMSNGRWRDPERITAMTVEDQGLARALTVRIPDDYRPAPAAARWNRADAVAAKVIDEILGGVDGVTEPGVARTVIDSLPTGGSLVVASSMPVRDVEWYGPSRRDVRVYANRGANGIDGTIATAIGVALAGSPTTLLIGDVAFLHDSTSLIAVGQRPVNLTIVVIDNDGGGIFSFLPQADLLPGSDFEELFGTPHGTDLDALCRAHGIETAPWPPESLPSGPVKVLIAKTGRDDNVALHNELNDAVARAIESV